MTPSETEDDSEDFLNFGEDLIGLPEIKLAGVAEVDFGGLIDRPLRLQEDLKEGCGGQLWPAGMVLAKYMLRRRMGGIQGRSIVELGAGGGLVGLAVALKSQTFRKPLWITDQLNMLELMQRNIAINGLEGIVQAGVYDWGDRRPIDSPEHPDIVLAADCVYFEPAFPLLQRTLLDLIGEQTVCYFCFKKRRRADMHFVKAIRKLFDVQEIDDDPDDVTWKREGLHMFTLRRRTTKE